MTKEQVLELMKKCEIDTTDAPFAYMINTISREDIENYYPDLMDKFKSLPSELQQRIINRLAESLKNMYEEWNFSEDMATLKEDFADWIEQER